MCGFAGIINFDGMIIDDRLHRAMKKAHESLYPRGPNQQGKWIDDYSKSADKLMMEAAD